MAHLSRNRVSRAIYADNSAVQPQDVAAMVLAVLNLPQSVDVAWFDILPTHQATSTGALNRTNADQGSFGWLRQRAWQQNGREIGFLSELAKARPLRRGGKPAEMAEWVLMAGGPRNTCMTGENIIVSGGYIYA